METRWGSDWLPLVVVVLCTCCCYLAAAADAEVQQLVPAYPDEATPYPNAIKCFVCESDVGNYECNKKAYDQYCPEASKYCYTQHTFNSSSGKTVQVHKECATLTQCIDTVGCYQNGNLDITECVSCCDWTICNDFAPHNSSLAQLFETSGAASPTLVSHSHISSLLITSLTTVLMLMAR